MSFLKKLGSVMLKVGQVVLGIMPMAQALIPQSASVASDLALFTSIIGQVEAMGQALQLSGADKFKAATPIISQVILQAVNARGQKIANPTLFQTACMEYTQATVDLMNSLHEEGVQTTTLA